MAVFRVNVPVTTTEPVATVDAGLPIGRHRFRLVVVDTAGLRSAPHEAVVAVQRQIDPGPIVVTPGPVVVNPGPIVVNPGPIVVNPGPIVSGPVIRTPATPTPENPRRPTDPVVTDPPRPRRRRKEDPS